MPQNKILINRLQEYYGKILKHNGDLQTAACCTDGSPPENIRKILEQIEPEVLSRYYGCGSPIPPEIEGLRILDLGCGSGRDAYILSKLVGENGYVLGLDMTEEQLAVAEKYRDAQMKTFDFPKPNVEFKLGYIEDLESVGIANDSFDVVVSNCVINLSPDKRAVFREIFRVLKPGGELYFSDVFSDRRLPEKLIHDPVLHGECLSGAMYIEDFRRILISLGCADYRTISRKKININNPEIEKRIGVAQFYTITVRAFKLPELEDICEDFGQAALYLGTANENPHYFDLDDHHRFFKGKITPVCGNTVSMLKDTRFGKHFSIIGDRSVHFGPFPCGPEPSSTNSTDSNESSCGC